MAIATTAPEPIDQILAFRAVGGAPKEEILGNATLHRSEHCLSSKKASSHAHYVQSAPWLPYRMPYYPSHCVLVRELKQAAPCGKPASGPRVVSSGVVGAEGRMLTTTLDPTGIEKDPGSRTSWIYMKTSNRATSGPRTINELSMRGMERFCAQTRYFVFKDIRLFARA